MSARFKKKTTSDAAGDIWPDDRLERCVLNTPSRRSCRRRDRPPSSDASQNAGACCRRARLFCRRGSIPSGHRPPSESSRVENLRKLLRHPRHQSLAGIGGGGGRSHALKTADTGVFRIITRAHEHHAVLWIWLDANFWLVWHYTVIAILYLMAVWGSGSKSRSGSISQRYGSFPLLIRCWADWNNACKIKFYYKIFAKIKILRLKIMCLWAS
jgi:hypothetical protein